MPDLSGARGAAVAEASATRSFSGRIEAAQFENGKPVLIRLLTPRDQWITALTHQYIPTKPRPADWKADKYPGKMWYICQNDANIFGLRDGDSKIIRGQFEPGYGSCEVETRFAGQIGSYNKPLDRPVPLVYTLCVLRQPVEDPVTKEYTGFTDVMEEWSDKSGAKHRVPAIRYIARQYPSVYSPMVQACYLAPKEPASRDFQITLKENKYEVVHANATPDHQPGTESWKVYDEAIALMGISLDAMVLEHASHEHFARFLVPQEGDSDGEPEASGDGSATAPASEGEAIDADKMAAFTAQLTSGAGK